MDAIAVVVLILALNLIQWQDRRTGRVRFTEDR